MDMAAIRQCAFEQMGNKSSHSFKEKGNKYYHGQRVAALAVRLREILFPDDDSHDDILTVAAWFHDIENGNVDIADHAKAGAEKARGLLTPFCSEQELDEICAIIRVHDDRYSPRDQFSDHIKVHQDADHLDHFGTFDIWMTFIYAVSHDQTINEARDWLLSERPTENERYRNELNFNISRRIFDEKIAFLKEFTERFQVESSGGIWHEEEFTK
ncbi:MAG: HD domain-containing protein [Oscillospiraceae bacterium]|nr:HD domain-containing protein [Oscillospiraceae bacterium]